MLRYSVGRVVAGGESEKELELVGIGGYKVVFVSCDGIVIWLTNLRKYVAV